MSYGTGRRSQMSRSTSKRLAIQTEYAQEKKSSLVAAIENKVNPYTLTENGAKTNKSTKNAVLDFFALGGALRSRTDQDIINLFMRSYNEDRDLAMKTLFYFRDVRGGQGERKTFRVIANDLASTNAMSILRNFKSIAEMGRWDDFFTFVGTRLEKEAFTFLKAQLDSDILKFKNVEKGISLLAKWLPSENTSSKATRTLAMKFRNFLGATPREYRTTLSDLRAYLNVIERDMSANKWAGMNYEKIPSRAHMIYRKAFGRHNQDGYAAYLASVEKGEKKINSSTLYPYDIAEKILDGNGDKTLDAQWAALPNYVPEGSNAIVVADVSGSMRGRPMASSVALALYFAERNTGIFHNYFMTFSDTPELVEVVGSTVTQKMNNISQASWEGSTNIQGVFNLILQTASESKIPERDMPKKIFIISDMEFNICSNNKSTNYETIKNKYRLSGYEMPTLIFWNVNARNNQSPITINDNGTMVVSGQSPSIFESVMKSKVLTPYDMMLEVLMKDRYSDIRA
jgi:hypothetical protein